MKKNDEIKDLLETTDLRDNLPPQVLGLVTTILEIVKEIKDED